MGRALNTIAQRVFHLLQLPPACRPRLTAAGRVFLITANLMCVAALVAAASFPSDEAEQLYWKNKAAQRHAAKAAERQNSFDERQQTKEMLDDLKREGAGIQPELILIEDGPPAPAAPPVWWENNGDYIKLGFAVALLVSLSASTLLRHRREAEIRALSGGYLSDGTEVAKFKMPDWFAPLPELPQVANAPSEELPPLEPAPDPAITRIADAVDEFFNEAPDTLAGIRAVLKELVGVEEPAARQQVLLQLHVLVHDISRRASSWDLRPAWQLSSALALLVKRIADNPKDVTSSSLRTISTAIDLLHELCVPGVRPNLIIDPPIRILAVDDEPLCLRALTYALQKANITVDPAEYGAKAVMLATEKPYDVIFMDIEMPDMDGLASCANIRRTQLNPDTPIVFVTIHNDFAMRARTIAIGGSDFMAKPFLVFELTVKAMTLLMRKRLDAAKSKRNLTTVSPVSSEAVESKITPAPTSDPAPEGATEAEPSAVAC